MHTISHHVVAWQIRSNGNRIRKYVIIWPVICHSWLLTVLVHYLFYYELFILMRNFEEKMCGLYEGLQFAEWLCPLDVLLEEVATYSIHFIKALLWAGLWKNDPYSAICLTSCCKWFFNTCNRCLIEQSIFKQKIWSLGMKCWNASSSLAGN